MALIEQETTITPSVDGEQWMKPDGITPLDRQECLLRDIVYAAISKRAEITAIKLSAALDISTIVTVFGEVIGDPLRIMSAEDIRRKYIRILTEQSSLVSVMSNRNALKTAMQKILKITNVNIDPE